MCIFSFARLTFFSCDLDLDPMTLTYEFDLDILKVYLHTKNKVCRSRLSEVKSPSRTTDTQTDATERIITPYSRMMMTVLKYFATPTRPL